MKLVIISGSNRVNSLSRQIADITGTILTDLEAEVDVLDLASTPLPLWNSSAQDPEGEAAQAFSPVAARLAACDGIVLVVPEWSGAVPPAFANLLTYLGRKQTFSKPTLPLAVSSGIGGSYVITYLRSFSFKNCGLLYLSEHLVIRYGARFVAAAAGDGSEPHQVAAYHRLQAACHYLVDTARALAPVRATHAAMANTYPFGM